MAGKQTYSGGCHCGAVRFEAQADLGQTVACNCSICQAKGLILSAVAGDDFRLLSGQDALTDYRFNTHKIAHQFCSTCGVEPFARGAGRDGLPMLMVNVRCLDGADLGTLSPKPFDGRKL